jgi:uncharacterized SAM-binding protein YcdF (DUF218 family)
VVDFVDIAASLLHPAVQALLLGALSVTLVLLRKPVPALAIGIVAVAWIWIASTPALALALRGALATPPSLTQPRADAIVVLGGGKLPVDDWSRATTRAGTGLTLWREGFAPVLLVSGSDQASQLAEGYKISGVPLRDLRVEASSTNTHENARNSAAILRANGSTDILLVTSAIHMRRAAGAFRHEGVTVSPVPAADAHAMLAKAPAWLPRRDALTLTARCLREYVALWIYRERGWI